MTVFSPFLARSARYILAALARIRDALTATSSYGKDCTPLRFAYCQSSYHVHALRSTIEHAGRRAAA